ncbi:hypothetical protein CDEN61S_01664 [Castellaniella denitrificans]
MSTAQEELNEAAETIVRLSDELDDMRDQLAVKAMDGTEDEKLETLATLRALRERIKALEAENRKVEGERNRLMADCAEKMREIRYWRRKAKEQRGAA